MKVSAVFELEKKRAEELRMPNDLKTACQGQTIPTQNRGGVRPPPSTPPLTTSLILAACIVPNIVIRVEWNSLDIIEIARRISYVQSA